MRIGIVTHHYVKNYGAYLQAKGLLETVKSLYPDAEVEIVNYVQPKHWLLNILHILHYRKKTDTLQTYGQQIRQLFILNKYEEHLPLSKRVFSGKMIKKMGYDLLIFGSDEIWDREGRGYSPIKYGVGMEGAAAKMIAYAPSVGRVDGKAPVPGELKKGLMNFDKLSARDSQTVDMLKQIGVDAPLVLDPSMLYDFEKELQAEKIQKLPYRYILIYDCKFSREQIVALKKYAAAHHLEIVGAGDNKKYYTKRQISITPYEWISLFKNAELIVTGTFHGTVFSIKYKKNFVSYPTELNRKQKITTLLQILKLEDRLLRVGDEAEMLQMFDRKTRYDEAESEMKRYYDLSVEYLKE